VGQSPSTKTSTQASGGSWKPWLDAQYQQTIRKDDEPLTDYLPPPVIADPLELPEPTPQPSTVIIYEPVEVIREVVRIVEVPVIVERTTNVCPVEKKPARKPTKTAPKVCK
jgi:hypothetical protein